MIRAWAQTVRKAASPIHALRRAEDWIAEALQRPRLLAAPLFGKSLANSTARSGSHRRRESAAPARRRRLDFESGASAPSALPNAAAPLPRTDSPRVADFERLRRFASPSGERTPLMQEKDLHYWSAGTRERPQHRFSGRGGAVERSLPAHTAGHPVWPLRAAATLRSTGGNGSHGAPFVANAAETIAKQWSMPLAGVSAPATLLQNILLQAVHNAGVAATTQFASFERATAPPSRDDASLTVHPPPELEAIAEARARSVPAVPPDRALTPTAAPTLTPFLPPLLPPPPGTITAGFAPARLMQQALADEASLETDLTILTAKIERILSDEARRHGLDV